MQISLPTRTVDENRAKLSARIVSGKEVKEVFFSVPAEKADWFSLDRCDGFVVGLLFQAMQRNENIVVEGPMSSHLFHNLQHFFIPMMSRAFESLHPIEIVPAALTHDATAATGVATGFSGGIDSFATIIQHFVQETDADYRINCFLFHNVGSHSHGSAEDARRLFWERYETVRPFTEEVNIPIIAVDSNLGDVFPISFLTMHSALNASIPLVLQNHFQRYYYASTYSYADCGVSRTDDIARFDPFAFHLLSTEGLDCVSTGCQMSRVQKTELVTTYEPTQRYLNVCVDPSFAGKNCSVCFKCMRTLFTLEVLGKAEFYEAVFDLAKYRQARSRYSLKILRYKRNSFEAEIADLVSHRGSGFLAKAIGVRRHLDRLAWH